MALAVVATTLMGPAAYAENSPCEGSCEGKQGDCREVEEGGQCDNRKLSPEFTDSPVDIQNNHVEVCVMPGSCSEKPS